MQMRASIGLSIVAALVLLLLLPYLFAGLMTSALAKLHISHAAAGQLVLAIILGGFINIPITRLSQPQELAANPLAMYGLDRLFPHLQRQPHQIVIAVNVGGCIIPLGIAIYQLSYIAAQKPELLWKTGIAVGVVTIVCYLLARPVPGVGIAMPGFVPPLVSTAAALLLAPGEAPPVAFVAGVVGSLVGADLLHLADVRRIGTGMASIGGAGTFDGIVLSGIIAAYLA
jgi:uncharacterized membrane protein